MNKKLFSILAIFSALLLLLRIVSGPSSAQFSEERVIDNLVSKHVPIKIKIKEDKERALKDMNNDRWTSDLELEGLRANGSLPSRGQCDSATASSSCPL